MSKTDNKRKKSNKKLLESIFSNPSSSGVRNLYDADRKALEKAQKPIERINIESLVSAPKEWNFFPKISEDKLLEMIFSIQENGLFNPIIVWKQRNNEYMILSGHNRVRAFNRIIGEYSNVEGFNKDKYESIPAIVFEKEEIDEDKAKEIIIDTNYIQREGKDLRRVMPFIVKNRLDIVEKRKDLKGRTIDVVAEELKISATKVYEDSLIANEIIPELSELYFNEELKKKPLLRFAWFEKRVQRWMYETFKDEINDQTAMKLKRDMKQDEIIKCFTEIDNIKRVNITMKVPEKHKDDFRKMATKWIKDREAEKQAY